MVYFKEGTPEEWLIFMDFLKHYINGQNTTLGAAKFVLAIRLLDGAAKTAFENAAQLCGGTTTNTSFQECLKAVMADVFSSQGPAQPEKIHELFLKKACGYAC